MLLIKCRAACLWDEDVATGKMGRDIIRTGLKMRR